MVGAARASFHDGRIRPCSRVDRSCVYCDGWSGRRANEDDSQAPAWHRVSSFHDRVHLKRFILCDGMMMQWPTWISDERESDRASTRPLSHGFKASIFWKLHVLYLGELNDSQEEAWCRVVDAFDEWSAPSGNSSVSAWPPFARARLSAAIWIRPKIIDLNVHLQAWLN
jgi:hypothetical protein